MCGIAGFIGGEYSRDSAEQLIDGMCRVIRHRGPDDQGTWVGDGVALGMRRLSIIDLSGGHQPIFNEDRSILVVFNGEIYNYRELQRELHRRGHSFATDCDTEAIVHAYEEYGDDCVLHLRGMFTFAIWDVKRRRLFAARDRFGKKPLNYYWDGRRLIFGSEIKSILEVGIPREVNPIALDEYLAYGYVPAPNTLFQGVQKVPAGHVLTYEAGQVKTTRYWELPFEPTCPDDEATALEKTRTLLKDAVQVRLMSDVPLGAFLSGGVDSSIVVGLMSELMSQPVKTFSIGFEDEIENELPYARRVAEHFGTDHHEFVVKPNLVSVLPELVWGYDEPFADSSMLPTYYVSKLAREFVTVALTGDGGDEIFGGYMSYQRELAIDRLPAGIRFAGRHVGRHIAARMPEGMRGKRRLGDLGSDLATRAVGADLVFPPGSRMSLYGSDFYAQVRDHQPRERKLSLFRATGHLDTAARMQYADAHLYLTDDILVKVDKASMLNSLETRTPMLDQHLVAYVASLPSALRTRDGTLKYLLKLVAADMLPADVLTRRKHGFGIPLERWLRRDLAGYARDLLDSPRAHQRGIFEPAYVRNLLRSHSGSRIMRTGAQIWTLLCLELWFQVYMDPPRPAAGNATYAQLAVAP
jgi:asparagine synthase (glutamine-hydrolysing)